MKITTLVENTTNHPDLGTQHGLSFYIEANGRKILFDMGEDGLFLQNAEKLGIAIADVDLAIVSHGHGDHVGGVAALVRATGAEFAIHAADAALAARAGQMSEVGRSYDEGAPAPDRALSEGDVLSVGTATFTVMETPGHTPGGVVLLGGGTAEGIAFVGDTLFPGSHGRTDLSGGDEVQIMASLRRMAAEIAPGTTLLCGHGPSTTMARELASNPFLR